MKFVLIWVFFILFSINFVECVPKKILFFWAVSGYSHRVAIWPLVEKLADKGHQITFLSQYEPKNPKPHPNIIEMVPEDLVVDVGFRDLDFISIRLNEGVESIDNLWHFYYEGGIRGCQSLMRNQTFVKWVNQSLFDLVVIDALHNECSYGLIHKFKAPHIMYSPSSMYNWFKDAYGIPDENLPEVEKHYSIRVLETDFLTSVSNVLRSLYWHYKRHNELFPLIEEMLKKGLDLPHLPPLNIIEQETAFIFTNTNPSEEYARSLPQNFVEVGGMHCRERNEKLALSKDVSDFIATADEGFILLSFGTYATISNLPLHLQTVFFNAMRRVGNIKFLVKYDKDAPTGLIPDNVHVIKWVQQQDILAHEKIRAFIGHGGLLGTQEAVFHGVPMILIPLFAEQDFNAVRAHERETAIALELKDLTEDQLVHAIRDIITIPKYKENALKLSKLFKDAPWTPVDKAVWYVEYTLRHRNISHLRPIGASRSWYQRRMLHIWGFLALIALTAGIIVTLAIYFFAKYFLGLRKQKTKSE